MELDNNNGIGFEVEGEDRLSVLTDDILLSILGRVDITTAVRTCVLSVRWKHLPWLLRELTIDVKDFLPVLQSNPIDAEHMDEAMSSLAKATRSFLANPRSEGAITNEAIDIGILKDLNLAILDEKEIEDRTEYQMLEQGSVVNGFFSAYPSGLVYFIASQDYLYTTLCFDEWDINHHLFECCKQLQHLYLSNCDMERCLVWKIDAPDSNLRVLELNVCLLGRLDVLCLPKLERLEWDTWLCPRFVLSEVLNDTTTIHTIKLDFQGEKLWLQPERKQLVTAFSKLRKLSLHGIFVEFNLLWTLVFLDAAPFLEMFDIEIWEHPCQINDSMEIFGERPNPSWKVPKFASPNNSYLKELQIIGFKPLEQQIECIRSVMQRAPMLDTILLKYDDPCEYCEKMGIFPPRPSMKCAFPKDKDEQDMVVSLLKDGISSPARIIFDNYQNKRINAGR
uniref:At1g61320/AtMIF1 LRR domain-containing protein n=1 Tax=Setaria viridis TaxID=4556 RepID=A0A4U6W1B8_SETVI|nr:hypothetical protein SEVIR_2G425000v2 [Setaria viridis]